jgi:hypothetical protein
MAKSKKTAKKKAPARVSVKLFEQSGTSVIRWMGKSGKFTTDEAEKVLARLKAPYPRSSIQTELGWGRSGYRPAAKLTSSQQARLLALKV